MTKITAILIVALGLASPSAAAQSRLKAELGCEATAAHLAYNCTVRIAEVVSGKAIDGLQVDLKADMPSMPMAHNIPPVRAEPTGEPGVYAFPIRLDMSGNWAFSIRLSGPREDLLVEILNFDADDAATQPCEGEDCQEAGHHDAH